MSTAKPLRAANDGADLPEPPDGFFDDEFGGDPASTRAAAGEDDGYTGEETDLRNGEHLARDNAGRLLYVIAWERWLAYDGKRYELDGPASTTALRFGAETIRRLAAQALEARKEAQAAFDAIEDKKSEAGLAAADKLKAANRLLRWRTNSQNMSRLSAMLKTGASRLELSCTHPQLDADPWLLNVANGTIDLRTGQLRPHSPADLITKLAPVVYDPSATCPTFEGFISQSMGGKKELCDYLARIIGYAITGTIREHVLAFHFGGGRNGKSTFFRLICKMLGDYAQVAPRGLLFTAKTEKHETELTVLCGARFVVCSEIAEGATFDEAKVKDLTGGDPVTARRMRENHWTFTPSHKLFLAGNHRPTVKGDDEGIWRRMRLTPWTVTVDEAEVDTALPDRLAEELPGILAWAVRGCLEWQKRGLDEPAIVKQATKDYRDQSDLIGQFFASRCIFDAGAPLPSKVARSVLRKAYESWCLDIGASPVGAKKFAERLRQNGVKESTKREAVTQRADGTMPSGVVDAWSGLRLRTDYDPIPEES